MAADLLEKLKVVAELGVQIVREQLAVLAVALVLLSVEEPVWNLVLARVLHDRHELVDLRTNEFRCTQRDAPTSSSVCTANRKGRLASVRKVARRIHARRYSRNRMKLSQQRGSMGPVRPGLFE